MSNKDHTSILRKKINAMQISTKGKRDLGMHILRIYHTKHFLDRVHIGERCPSQTKQVVVASQTTPFAAYALSISFFLLSFFICCAVSSCCNNIVFFLSSVVLCWMLRSMYCLLPIIVFVIYLFIVVVRGVKLRCCFYITPL